MEGDFWLWVGIGAGGLLALWIALNVVVLLGLGAVSLFASAARGWGLAGVVAYVILWVIALPLMFIAALVKGLAINSAEISKNRSLRG